jgi:type VI secretion system protein ImpF
MATLTPQERLQPALLDRLIDDAPENTQEVREARLINLRRLRAAVLRDLAWLLNAVRPSDEIDAARYPYAHTSVINYGLPPLSGTTASTLDAGNLELRIRQAIQAFEPRIIASSLKVEALTSDIGLDHHNQIEIVIRGKLWAQPVPLEIMLRTAMDLETAQVTVQDVTS